MRKHRSALSYYKAFKERLEQIPHVVARAHEDLARHSLEDIRELTAGQRTQRQLDRMGNPRGRGFVNPRGKPRARMPWLPINRQTGRLSRSAFLERRAGGSKQVYAVGFKLPRSDPRKYILSRTGTRKMVATGFWPEVVKRWRARNKALLDAFSRSVRS